jgi:hypothetical protein
MGAAAGRVKILPLLRIRHFFAVSFAVNLLKHGSLGVDLQMPSIRRDLPDAHFRLLCPFIARNSRCFAAEGSKGRAG